MEKIIFFKLKILKRIKQKGSKLLLGKYKLLCFHSEPILQMRLKRRKEPSLSDFSSQEKAEWQYGSRVRFCQLPRNQDREFIFPSHGVQNAHVPCIKARIKTAEQS